MHSGLLWWQCIRRLVEIGLKGEEMKNRGNNVATRFARQGARKLSAHEALAELERAQRVFLRDNQAFSGMEKASGPENHDQIDQGVIT
jgi:hypothetical protein